MKRSNVFSVFAFLFCLLMANVSACREIKHNSETWLGDSSKNFQFVSDPAKEKESLRQKEASKSIRCLKDNFDLFFAFFSEDPSYQQSSTYFSIKYTHNKNGGVEADIETSIQYLRKPQRPDVYIFPNKVQRRNDRLRYDFKNSFIEEGHQIIVNLQLEDAGYNLQFIFTWEGCWHLSEIIENNF